MVLLALSSAFGAECTAVSPVDLAGRLDMFDSLFAKGRTDSLTPIIEETEAMLPCVNAVVKPSDVARFAHDMAIVRFYQQDEDEAIRWAHAADAAYSQYPWPSVVGPTHPLRQIIAEAVEPGFESAEGRTLAPPKGGAVFLNGRYLDKPEARADVPVLMQTFTAKGREDGWWQDGGSFPEMVLGYNTVVKKPSWVPAEEEPAVTLADARKRYGDASAEGVANVDVCKPLDAAGFREQVATASEALDNDDLPTFGAVYKQLRVEVACFTEPVPRETWARFLVDLAVVEYATGQLWPEPLGTALFIQPTVDRSGTPSELQAYRPPPASLPGSVKLPTDATFYVDGRQVTTVPDLSGVHIIQRLKVRWDTRFVRNAELPPEWLGVVAPTTVDKTTPGDASVYPPIVIGVVAGLGTASQASGVDGTDVYVPSLSDAGFHGAVASTGHVPAGPVGVFWDGALGVAPSGLRGAAYAGLSIGRSVVVDIGGGVSTAGLVTRPVDDPDVRQTYFVPQARLGLGAVVPLGGLNLDLGLAGGGSPSGAHVRVRAGVADGSDAPLSWYGGLEVGDDVAWFVQDGVERTITSSGIVAGVRLGARL